MLKKISLSEQAYQKLVRKIITGKYPAGTRLTEEGLCEEFGISRTPVRDAISKLIGEGLVEPLPRRGCRVSVLDPNAVHELFECRSHLECIALKSSIERIPEKKLEELVLFLQITDTPEKMKKNSLEADSKLHSLIADYCSNRYIKTLLAQLFRQSLPFRSFRSCETEQDLLNAERRNLIQAILERNYAKASELLNAHIMGGCLKSS